MTALRIEGLRKSFGALRATDDVSLTIAPGEMHALIGPNGAGKTTLVSLIAGEHGADAGRILLLGHDVTRLPVHRRARLGLGRSFQITQLLPEETAEANAAMAVQAVQGHAFRFWREAARDPSLLGPARAALDRVGLGARAGTRVADLSHGERRQLELAIVLARGAEVLLLDEPMAGLGHEEGLRMTEQLRALKGRHAVLLVEHDMDAVFALADRITVLVRGRVIATGTPDEIRRDPEVRAAYLGDSLEDAPAAEVPA
ncbi:ABC transporter ATP-binding protein [Roseomonas sp. CCTCC AB2023176]|uniref:ABC transporter ATP-binding protein n=1 Tax=Roseomonas sp. CCTCC AB2023176 TaxID=3342640 RepID=UPI0035E1D4A5